MRFTASYVHKSDLTAHLTEQEIREIITSQSHKREPTPPPPNLSASSTQSGGGGVALSKRSEAFAFPGGRGDMRSTSVPATVSADNVLSSPSYASALTRSSMSPASSTSSNNALPSKPNENHSGKAKKNASPLLPQVLGAATSQNQPLMAHPPTHIANPRPGLYGSPPALYSGSSSSICSTAFPSQYAPMTNPSFHSHVPQLTSYSNYPPGKVIDQPWGQVIARNDSSPINLGPSTLSPSRNGGPSSLQNGYSNSKLQPGDAWTSNVKVDPELDEANFALCGSNESALNVSLGSLDSDHGRSVSFSSDKFPPRVSGHLPIL